MKLNNRLVMPPMATHKSDGSGKINQGHIDYYVERAKGCHMGMIITEHSCVCDQGRADSKQTSMASDECANSFKPLLEAVHKEEVKMICQLNHAGSNTSQTITGQPIVSASAIQHPRKRFDEIPHALTIEEIHQMEDLFVEAAIRAKNAGYDGVEIHSAHGYLLNQFYSPLTNKRNDAYGCDTIENRTRMACEMIQKVRKVVGKEYPILIRLGGCDYMDGGSTIEDAIQASLLLEKAGADCVDITGGMNGYIRPGHTEAGYFSDCSKAVKEVISIPVILTGGVNTMKEADSLLMEEKADLIGVGRKILVNPQWANQ